MFFLQLVIFLKVDVNNNIGVITVDIDDTGVTALDTNDNGVAAVGIVDTVVAVTGTDDIDVGGASVQMKVAGNYF